MIDWRSLPKPRRGRGRPPLAGAPGGLAISEIVRAVLDRRIRGLPVTLVDVAVDLGVGRSTLLRYFDWVGGTWTEFVGPARRRKPASSGHGNANRRREAPAGGDGHAPADGPGAPRIAA